MDASAYARQLKQLLPPGRLWALGLESWLSDVLLGIADELVRVDGRAQVLVEEWDPRTATETLEDWERVLAVIPEVGESEAARRLAVAAKLIARGGATPVYFGQLASALGFAVSINGFTATHVWTMTVDLANSTSPFSLRTTVFRAGAARAGDRLRNWSIPELEDVINAAKPAHTVARFVYEE